MKKFFCAIFSFVLVSLLCFTGCSDGWTEVQSITYAIGSSSTTYTSKIVIHVIYEDIEETTYNNAPEEKKHEWFLSNSQLPHTHDVINDISVNRQESISSVENELNTETFNKIFTADFFGEEMVIYNKCHETYELRYVKIRFSDNDCIEINYYDDDENKTVKVKPASYEITYFED